MIIDEDAIRDLEGKGGTVSEFGMMGTGETKRGDNGVGEEKDKVDISDDVD